MSKENIPFYTHDPSEPKLRYTLEIFRDITGIELIPQLVNRNVASIPCVLYAPEKPSHFRGVFLPYLPEVDCSSEFPLTFCGPLTRDSKVHGSEITVYGSAVAQRNEGGYSSENGSIIFSFDLLKNCFLRLSCAKERQRKHAFHTDQSYVRNNCQRDAYLKPMVNYLFELFQLSLRVYWPNLAEIDTSRRQSSLLLSHDIDALQRTYLKAIKQLVMNVSKIPRVFRCRNWERSQKLFSQTFSLFFGKDDFDQIERWTEIDRMGKAVPLFYVYVRSHKKGLRKKICSWIFDPQYDLAKDKGLQKRLRRLSETGVVFGLHGSYDSYNDGEALTREKKILEDTIGCAVKHVRQHWLRFSFRDTWRAQEEAGFQFDAGFGFNNQVGFRSWLAHSHRPWDEERQQAHKLFVVPLVAMDSTLFDYLCFSDSQVAQTLSSLLAEVQKFNGTTTINWHTHGASHHLQWHQPYVRFLQSLS